MLQKIYYQNPWFRDENGFKKDNDLNKLNAFAYIWRKNDFLDHNFADGVYLCFGPRQIGKTTHMKWLLRDLPPAIPMTNRFYFNCDFLSKKEELIELLITYLENVREKSNQTYIVIDEISSIPDAIIAIKFMIDQGYHQKTTFILTGSSSVNIRKTGEYLPGRRGKGIDFKFHPLSFKDFTKLLFPEIIPEQEGLKKLSVKELEAFYLEWQSKVDFLKLFDDYLICGGIPRVINEFQMKRTISSEVFDTYRNWIVSEIAKSDRKEYICKVILDRILISLTSDISYNAIIQDTGVGSHNTAHDYIDFLSSAFIIDQLFHYDLNKKKINYRKNKKLYFYDPFILWVVDHWLKAKNIVDFSALDDPILKSRIVENACYCNLRPSEEKNLHFYRDKVEIDFVHLNNLFEVKYQNRIQRADLPALMSAPDTFQKWVLCNNSFLQFDQIRVLPAALYFLQG